MNVVFVAYEGLTALDLVGPLEVLSRVPGAEVQVAAVRAGVAVSDTGTLGLVARRSLDDVRDVDVMVVPGGAAGTWKALEDLHLLRWVREAGARAEWVSSVCTGSLILGAAGLLQGRRATSHWAVRDQLRDFGAVPAASRVVWDGNVVTAAGVSAGIDMALSLVARSCGQDVAEMIQLVIEYDPQPPFAAGNPEAAGETTVHAALASLAQQF